MLPTLRDEAKRHAESTILMSTQGEESSKTVASPHPVSDIAALGEKQGLQLVQEKEEAEAEVEVEVEAVSSVKKSRLLGRIKGTRSTPPLPPSTPPVSTSTSTSTSASHSSTAVKSAVEIAAEASMQKYRDMLSTSSTSTPLPPHTCTLTPPPLTSLRAAHASLSVLCRTPLQVTAACSLPYIQEITLDFLEVHGLREAVQEIKNAKKVAVVATPRIIKPNEERLYTFYLRLKADALLVRSAGFLNQLLELGGAGAVLANSNITIPDLRGRLRLPLHFISHFQPFFLFFSFSFKVKFMNAFSLSFLPPLIILKTFII